ncbi:YqfQ-like protein [Ornithinibacillus halophilus]|uniref:YqfQ-like protein n=2 Tax=Ornithinibacillus halophilus TaxID=930117 RepID=A0A1M5CKN0_9BACI|nr:YqfQ-like protein [Ornithinibacillus halophilus]
MVFPSPRNQRFQHPNQFNRAPQNMYFPNRVGGPGPSNSLPNMIRQLMNPSSSVTDMASKGVGGLSNTLNNVQQVLRVIDNTAPMVKQYGPMVRNLPMMFKMIKAFKDLESSDGESDKSYNESSNIDDLFASSESSAEIEVKDKPQKRSNNGQSTPKLYI